MSDSQGNDPLIGTLIGGRYRILEKLGEGAMGAVYVAEHVRIGRRDAIKLLRGAVAADAETIARFSRGARIVSAIRHPNVCSIYDFGDTEEGHQFLAMEYVAGGTLRELLEREGRLATARALRIAQQTAGALQAAHDAGIVHRDLKPANIMLATSRDGLDEVKVVDFDIAKVAEGGGEEVTRLGFVVGTPEYMSPEQLMGERLDGRSDVYSLGLVLFRMLTGTLPFRANTTQDVMVERLTHTPLTLAEVVPGTSFPEGLESVIARALQRRTADRCASAAEFANALAALGERSPPGALSAHPPAPAHSTAVYPRAQGNTAPAVQETPPTRVSGPAESAAASASAQSAGMRRLAMPIAIGAVLLTAAVAAGVMLFRGDEPVSDDGGLTGPMSIDSAAPSPANPIAAAADSQPQSNPVTRGGSRARADSVPPLRTVTDPPVTPVASVPGGIVIPAAQARSVLDQQLFRLDPDQPPGAVALQATIDTATSLWQMRSLASTDRALAAYVIGSAFDLRGDWAQCTNWLDSALVLNPQGRGYAELRNKCRGMRE